MNRTILIVICDFLLVSLLAFSTVDINKIAEGGAAQQVRLEIATNTVESGRDLAAVMRQALDEERKNRDLLLGELARSRETASRQQALLGERDKQLQDYQQSLQAREQQAQQLEKQLETRQQEAQQLQQQLQARQQEAQQLQQQLQVRQQEAERLQRQLESSERQAAQLQQDLQARQAEARRLQQEIEAREARTRQLQQERASLEAQFAAAQTNLAALSRQVQLSSNDALISKERLAAMEAELRKQADQAAAMQQQLQELARSNQAVVTEKQHLATQLQVAEVEKRHAAEQVVRMEKQVQAEREEKARLVEGVKILASKSSQLEQEIRENRPLAANAIFNEFATNRVAARIQGVRPGLFGGESVRRKDTETVLVSDGTNLFALCHVDDTPLALWNPGAEWEGLAGTLSRGSTVIPLRMLSFSMQDPRVVMLPVTAEEARQLGAKVYRIASDPFKFQDAVLVGAREGYYGECRFQIDVSTPEYVQLDRSFLRGLFGKFNPSRGDLVLSKNGELLGIMANNTYCLRLTRFDPAATFRFGPEIRQQNTAQVLALLYNQVAGLPGKLQ